jgi:hypothetical protein
MYGAVSFLPPVCLVKIPKACDHLLTKEQTEERCVKWLMLEGPAHQPWSQDPAARVVSVERPPTPSQKGAEQRLFRPKYLALCLLV